MLHCRKTISHDWDQAHKEGKTMFRLPKECITGHVEGWTLACVLLTAITFTDLPYCHNLLSGVFFFERPDLEDADPHEPS